MSSLHDLKDMIRRRADEADSRRESVEQAVVDARRRLGEERDRLGEAAAETIEALRDDADVAVRDARRRARRLRRRARKQTRAVRGNRRTPVIALAILAGVSAIAVGLAKGGGRLRSVAGAGASKARAAAGRDGGRT